MERLILSIPNPQALVPDYSPEYFLAPSGRRGIRICNAARETVEGTG